MADDADRTAEHDFSEACLKNFSLAKNKPVIRRGVCLNCDEKIASSLIYCDEDCREAKEYRDKVARTRV